MTGKLDAFVRAADRVYRLLDRAGALVRLALDEYELARAALTEDADEPATEPDEPEPVTAPPDEPVTADADERAILLRALKLVCATLAAARDGDPLPHGWLEDLKYQVVDRAIECAEPGFDGGETSLVEARDFFRRVRGGHESVRPRRAARD